jgi:hypothetical protein
VKQAESLLAANSTNVALLNGLAYCYDGLASLGALAESDKNELRQKATALLQQATILAPDDPNAFSALAARSESEEQREVLLRTVLSIDAAHGLARRELAWLLIRKKEYEESLRLYVDHLRANSLSRAESVRALAFGRELEVAGFMADAVSLYEEVLRATTEMDPLERCGVFDSMTTVRYAAFLQFLFRLRDLRAACP